MFLDYFKALTPIFLSLHSAVSFFIIFFQILQWLSRQSMYSKIEEIHFSRYYSFVLFFVSQGVTAIKSLKTPFRKSAFFSTPISERLDEIDLPPDNWDCISDDPITSPYYKLLWKTKCIYILSYCQWCLHWLAANVKPDIKHMIF